MVTENSEVIDFSYTDVESLSQLVESSIMVKTGHGSEVLSRDILTMVLKDKAVGVARVTNYDDLDVTTGIVVDVLTGFDEDLSIILEEIASFHARSSGLGAYEESIVDIFESGSLVISGYDTSE